VPSHASAGAQPQGCARPDLTRAGGGANCCDNLIEAKKVAMVVLAVIGGIVIATIAAAAAWDQRERRRGARTDVSRSDIEVREGERWPSWPEDDRQ
jgi:hypothetical protein